MPSVQKINPVAERIQRLKSDMVYAGLLGSHKDFAKAHKEFASLAINNFELAKNIPGPSASVPLFSKYGPRMFKVWLLEKLRIYTPEEKQLKKLVVENAKEMLAEKKQVPKELQKYIHIKG